MTQNAPEVWKKIAKKKGLKQRGNNKKMKRRLRTEILHEAEEVEEDRGVGE
jgi:hypothetical protein